MPGATKLCPGCQSENEAANSFCFKCGLDLKEVATTEPAATSAPASTFSWGWVGWSVLIIMGTTTIVSFTIGFLYALTGGRNIPPPLAFVAGALGLLLGGMITGYKSPGVTIKEPAVAAAIVTVFFVLMNKDYSSLVLGWVMPFGLAYLGAWIGEKIQGTI